jgi:hypothetical protein
MSDLDPAAQDPNPLAAPPPDFNLKGKSSKTPLIIGVALVVGGGGFAGFRMVSTRNNAKMHASFMERFQSLEKDDVGNFWACLIGPNLDPGMFGDNIAFGGKIEATFNSDPKDYPGKVLDTCVPRLAGLGKKAAELDGPSDYREALEAYGKALDALADGAKDWAEHAKTRIPEREADQAVEKAATAFHEAAPGKAGADAIGYERFMRCAVPDIDKLKDEQALLQHLFEECKKPDFVQHARFECSKLAAGTDTKEDKHFKDAQKKFQADDRDASAWADCFRKGRKGAKRDDMAVFGKAYVGYMEAGGNVRKIGAAALKND